MAIRGPQPKAITKAKDRVVLNWSSDFAYAIGLLATDGCLSKDGRCIDLTSKDMEQLHNFMKCLNVEIKIGKKKSGLGHISYRIQLSDIPFYNFLFRIGLSPAKSLILQEIKIADLYFFDFLRGCFDGDGCSYSYWDSRWKSSFMFYICFESSSEKFIVWLRNTIFRLGSIKGHITVSKKKNTLYQLRYAKSEAINIVEYMYKDKDAVKLSRKYLKIQETLSIVRMHSKNKVFIK